MSDFGQTLVRKDFLVSPPAPSAQRSDGETVVFVVCLKTEVTIPIHAISTYSQCIPFVVDSQGFTADSRRGFVPSSHCIY